MSPAALLAKQALSRSPFFLAARRGLATTVVSAFPHISGTTFSVSNPIAAGSVPRKMFPSKFVKHTTLSPELCDEVTDIARGLSKFSKIIDIPASPEFMQAAKHVKDLVEEDDGEDGPLADFKEGRIQAIIYHGHFGNLKESDTANFVISTNVSHFVKRNRDMNIEEANRELRRYVPDWLFAAALTSSRSKFDQADLIESLSNQHPHVDFNSTMLDIGSQRDVPDIIYFAGICSNPFPETATIIVPVDEILEYFSDEEIKFLKGKNFFLKGRGDQGGYSKSFAIIEGKSMIWDGLWQANDSIDYFGSFPGQEVLIKINQVVALLVHQGVAVPASLGVDSKVFMRNFDLKLGNVLHFRTQDKGPVGEGSSVNSYGSNPNDIFKGGPDEEAPVPAQHQPRKVIRFGFKPAEASVLKKDDLTNTL